MRKHIANAAIEAFDILFAFSVGAKPKDEGDGLDHWRAWQETRKAAREHVMPWTPWWRYRRPMQHFARPHRGEAMEQVQRRERPETDLYPEEKTK